jgi:capsular polysaccharide biosynthesis protein
MATTRTRPAAPPDLEAEAEVDLGHYGHALLARWWLLLAGLVVGAILGYLSTLGGAQVYRAQAVTYMGQPLGSGQSQVQALNTNPSSARTIITSDAVVRRIARRAGMTESQLRSGTSVTAVQGFNARLNQTPLIAITVKGPEPGKSARAADLLANVLVSALSGVSAPKIKVFDQQIKADTECIKIANAALDGSDLSTTEKILLQGRLQGCQSDLTTTTQLSLLAKNVEAPRVITQAVAEKTAARSHRNATAVGALIGLILGGIVALLWDPVARRRARHA